MRIDNLSPDEFFDRVLADDGRSSGSPLGPAAEWQRWWSAVPRDDPMSRLAARQGFALTTGQLREFGITRSAARHAVACGRWLAPMRGAVVVADLARDNPDRFVLARRRHAVAGAAAVLVRPWFVASGRTAAIMHGLPTVAVPVQPELSTPLGAGPGHRSRSHLHAAGLGLSSMTFWHGASLQTPARALIDLGRHDRRDAIMAADAALREGVVTRAEIVSELHTACGWPGVKQARAVLALASPKAESPLESLVRLAMHDDPDFPTPEEQLWIGGDRVDFAFPRRRFVVEADGRGKYGTQDPWYERHRERRLRRAGWTVERVTWEEVFDWPTTRIELLRSLHLHRPSGR